MRSSITATGGAPGKGGAKRPDINLFEAWKCATLAALVLFGACGIALAVWSLNRGGAGLDSYYQTKDAFPYRFLEDGVTLSEAFAAAPLSRSHGIIIQQLADVAHTLRGGATRSGSSASLLPEDPATYVYQGLVSIFFGVTAVTALAIVIGLTLRSWLAAAFAWSLVQTTPLWLGSSHVNFKDIPAAAGLTLVSAGLILSVSGEHRRGFGVALALSALGGAVALGTRPGTLVLVGALAACSLLLILVWTLSSRNWKPLFSATFVSGVAVISGMLFLWLTNPVARTGLAAFLGDAIGTSSAFPWNGRVRVAGTQVLATDLPLWYVPAWLLAQLPVLTLLALVTSLCFLALRLTSRIRSRQVTTRVISLAPIAVQALVLPAMIILANANLYDGIRHVLFLVPALLAFPAIGLAAAQHSGRLTDRQHSVGMPIAAVAIVAMSLFAAIRWAPYDYAFVNPVAGIEKKNPWWELDYWGISSREGISRLKSEGLTLDVSRPFPEVAVPYGGSPYLSSVPNPSGDTGLYVFRRGDVRATDFGCRVLFEIKRDGLMLGEGARCPPGVSTAK